MKLAVECVGKSSDLDLAKHLIDFLMGELDGVPKVLDYNYGLFWMRIRNVPDRKRTV